MTKNKRSEITASENHLIMEIKQQPLTETLKKQIYEGFSRHAIAMTGHNEKFENVAFVAMDGKVLAGAIVVELFWGALHIKYIYVEDLYRAQKLGTQLMEKAFAYAEEHKCPFAFVETMSFQALKFYEKYGFKLEYTRSGYAHNTSFHYLRKDFTSMEIP